MSNRAGQHQRRSRQRTSSARRRCYRPLLEQLEDRRLLAAIPVTSTDDGAPAVLRSLREAVVEANTNDDDFDIITVPAGTYTLAEAGRGEDAAATGDLDITQDTDGQNPFDQTVIIFGEGPNETIIDGGAIDRVFDVHPGAQLIVVNATVRNGDTGPAENGAGIRNRGSLTIAAARIEASDSSDVGGGIYNAGTFDTSTITTETFTQVQDDFQQLVALYADEDGDNVPDIDQGDLQATQAILSSISDQLDLAQIDTGSGGTFVAIRSTIAGNTAADEGGGLFNDGGLMFVTGTTFTGNVSTNDSGGGLFNFAGAVAIANSTFSSNTAATRGGGFVNASSGSTGKTLIVNSTFSDNEAASGGAIFNAADSVLGVLHATITDNRATDAASSNAGGFLNELQITDADQNNVPEEIRVGIALVQNSIIAGNDLTNVATPPVVDSLTGPYQGNDVSGAIVTGGGNVIGDASGQITDALAGSINIDTSGLVTATSEDFSLDSAAVGFIDGRLQDQVGGRSGVVAVVSRDPEVPLLDDSPIMITSPGHGLATGNTVTISGVTRDANANGLHEKITVLSDNTFTLDMTTFAGVGGLEPNAQWRIAAIDPLLEPLAGNGGPTQTHALQPGSPAIDAGRNEVPIIGLEGHLPSDQRGLPRPVDGTGDDNKIVDAGAFEFGTFEVTLPGPLAADVSCDFDNGDLVCNNRNITEVFRQASNRVTNLIINGTLLADQYDFSNLPAEMSVEVLAGDGDTITGGVADELVRVACDAAATITDTQISCGSGINDVLVVINKINSVAFSTDSDVDAGGATIDLILELIGDGITATGGSGNDVMTALNALNVVMNGGDGNDLLISTLEGLNDATGGPGNDRHRIFTPRNATALDVTCDANGCDSAFSGAAGFTPFSKHGRTVETLEFVSTGTGLDINIDPTGDPNLQRVHVLGDNSSIDGSSFVGSGVVLDVSNAAGSDPSQLRFDLDDNDHTFAVDLGELFVPPASPVGFMVDGTTVAMISGTALTINGPANSNLQGEIAISPQYEAQFQIGIVQDITINAGGGVSDEVMLRQRSGDVPGSQPMGETIAKIQANGINLQLHSPVPPSDATLPPVSPISIIMNDVEQFTNSLATETLQVDFADAAQTIDVQADANNAGSLLVTTDASTAQMSSTPPLGSLILNGGGLNDAINVAADGLALQGPLTIDGKGGTDLVGLIITGDPNDNIQANITVEEFGLNFVPGSQPMGLIVARLQTATSATIEVTPDPNAAEVSTFNLSGLAQNTIRDHLLATDREIFVPGGAVTLGDDGTPGDEMLELKGAFPNYNFRDSGNTLQIIGSVNNDELGVPLVEPLGEEISAVFRGEGGDDGVMVPVTAPLGDNISITFDGGAGINTATMVSDPNATEVPPTVEVTVTGPQGGDVCVPIVGPLGSCVVELVATGIDLLTNEVAADLLRISFPEGLADDILVAAGALSGTTSLTSPTSLAISTQLGNRLVIDAGAENDTITIDSFADGFDGVLDIFGGDGNDTARFLFDDETPLTTGGSNFDGGQGGFDTLILDGCPTCVPVTAPLGVIIHTLQDATSGTIQFEGVQGVPGIVPLGYSELEPIFDNLNAVDRVFNFPDTADNITFNTGDDSQDNILRIDSNNSEVVDFVEPSGTLTVNFGDGDDGFDFDLPIDKLPITNGGAGADDELILVGADQTLDLTNIADADFTELAVIDITGSGDNTLILDLEEVQNLSAASDELVVFANPGDTVDRGAGWSFTDARVIDDDFFHVFEQDGATLFVAGTDWQNPTNPLDVNLDGEVVPQDALIIINELNLPQFSGDQNIALDPFDLASDSDPDNDFDDLFRDVNGDGFFTGIDAIRVINFLNDDADTEGEAAAYVDATQIVRRSAPRTDTEPIAQSVPRRIEDDSAWYLGTVSGTARSRDDFAAAIDQLAAGDQLVELGLEALE